MRDMPQYVNQDLNVNVVAGEVFVLPPHYTIADMIGQGAHGKVCSAINEQTEELVAVKKNSDVFPHSKMRHVYGRRTAIVDSVDQDPIDLIHPLRVLRELKILSHLSQHPYIVQLKDAILPSSYDEFCDLYMVTDYMPTDLRSFLNTKKQLQDDHIQYILYQLLMAVLYAHSADIVHRDIKPENILLDSECEIRLCDFGMARGINEKNPHNSSNYVQTRWYRAPEMILDSDNVTNAIDIWSVGCVFAELLQRQVLFAGENPAQQLEYILSVTGTPKKKVGSLEGQIYLEKLPVTEGQDLHVLFLGCNVQAIDLLSKMIQFHPDDRIGAFEALRHPYFSSLFYEEDLFVAEKFDFRFEQRMTSIEAIKKEAFLTLLEFSGILDRRRSCDESSIAKRKPSQAMDEIQKDLKSLVGTKPSNE